MVFNVLCGVKSDNNDKKKNNETFTIDRFIPQFEGTTPARSHTPVQSTNHSPSYVPVLCQPFVDKKPLERIPINNADFSRHEEFDTIPDSDVEEESYVRLAESVAQIEKNEVLSHMNSDDGTFYKFKDDVRSGVSPYKKESPMRKTSEIIEHDLYRLTPKGKSDNHTIRSFLEKNQSENQTNNNTHETHTMYKAADKISGKRPAHPLDSQSWFSPSENKESLPPHSSQNIISEKNYSTTSHNKDRLTELILAPVLDRKRSDSLTPILEKNHLQVDLQSLIPPSENNKEDDMKTSSNQSVFPLSDAPTDITQLGNRSFIPFTEDRTDLGTIAGNQSLGPLSMNKENQSTQLGNSLRPFAFEKNRDPLSQLAELQSHHFDGKSYMGDILTPKSYWNGWSTNGNSPVSECPPLQHMRDAFPENVPRNMSVIQERQNDSKCTPSVRNDQNDDVLSIAPSIYTALSQVPPILQRGSEQKRGCCSDHSPKNSPSASPQHQTLSPRSHTIQNVNVPDRHSTNSPQQRITESIKGYNEESSVMAFTANKQIFLPIASRSQSSSSSSRTSIVESKVVTQTEYLERQQDLYNRGHIDHLEENPAPKVIKSPVRPYVVQGEMTSPLPGLYVEDKKNTEKKENRSEQEFLKRNNDSVVPKRNDDSLSPKQIRESHYLDQQRLRYTEKLRDEEEAINRSPTLQLNDLSFNLQFSPIIDQEEQLIKKETQRRMEEMTRRESKDQVSENHNERKENGSPRSPRNQIEQDPYKSGRDERHFPVAFPQIRKPIDIYYGSELSEPKSYHASQDVFSENDGSVLPLKEEPVRPEELQKQLDQEEMRRLDIALRTYTSRTNKELRAIKQEARKILNSLDPDQYGCFQEITNIVKGLDRELIRAMATETLPEVRMLPRARELRRIIDDMYEMGTNDLRMIVNEYPYNQFFPLLHALMD